MTIYQGSRYEFANVVKALAPNGSTRNTILATSRPEAGTVVYHTVAGGDRIDVIAYDYYGDATRWWVIADANPDWFWWDNLPVGLILRVPHDVPAA